MKRIKTQTAAPLIVVKPQVTQRGLDALKQLRSELGQRLRREVAEPRDKEKGEDGESYTDKDYSHFGLQSQFGATCALIQEAVVVPEPTDNKKVAIGTTVKITRDSEEEMWGIVGQREGDGMKTISFDAPLAEALMDQEVGFDEPITIKGRTFQVKILEISISIAGSKPETE